MVNVWESKRPEGTLQKSLSGAIMSYHGLTFSGDDRRLVAGSGSSQMVAIRETETFESVLTLPGRGWAVSLLAFSPDGNALVCGGNSLHVWKVDSWDEIKAAESEERRVGR
ncbi:MAG TPA: hypothetical protein EYQ50_20020 [Verrucomicrobiales bacterium]|nr:hypothetical protein [Verrucomicrobiales bacterium]HIL69874.1 hypothetical protein [Verrucomicrobiota bacterium]